MKKVLDFSLSYQVESFSWGLAHEEPNVSKCIQDCLEAAIVLAKNLFENHKVFQVRVLSEACIQPSARKMYNLHFMKCRPTNDKPVNATFQKIKAEVGREIDFDVLRVKDFMSEIHINQIRLKSLSFWVLNLPASEPSCFEPSINITSARSECLEKCLGKAGSLSDKLSRLLNFDDNTWDYLSEIDVSEEKALMSFKAL